MAHMKDLEAHAEHGQTVSEEIANSVSHGVGLALAITATPVLIIAAARGGTVWNIVGVSIFAASMILLYLASTLYHAIPHDRAKSIFRVLDHGAIFLLIAGTYTPFTLGVMRGPWGWTIFGLVWSMAVFGLTMKAIFGAHHRWLTVPLYLVMGWLAVIAAPHILFRMPLPALVWLLAGGFAYTAGVLCFKAHKVRYSHFAWHLFVIAGTVCHFFAVLWYSA
ncbi:MAG TPA: hemolysin III family protein [Pyrinomonadaceae bacterium]|jgi:hemolysin III|nr:hemolysin III family protein [Pyrinomonadaceae bacterium]